MLSMGRTANQAREYEEKISQILYLLSSVERSEDGIRSMIFAADQAVRWSLEQRPLISIIAGLRQIAEKRGGTKTAEGLGVILVQLQYEAKALRTRRGDKISASIQNMIFEARAQIEESGEEEAVTNSQDSEKAKIQAARSLVKILHETLIPDVDPWDDERVGFIWGWCDASVQICRVTSETAAWTFVLSFWGEDVVKAIKFRIESPTDAFMKGCLEGGQTVFAQARSV